MELSNRRSETRTLRDERGRERQTNTPRYNHVACKKARMIGVASLRFFSFLFSFSTLTSKCSTGFPGSSAVDA